MTGVVSLLNVKLVEVDLDHYVRNTMDHRCRHTCPSLEIHVVTTSWTSDVAAVVFWVAAACHHHGYEYERHDDDDNDARKKKK